MKVVFLEEVEGSGRTGEIKDVANGFARNYLLPRGLAAPAVEPYLTRAEARAKREAIHQEELDQNATSVAERVEGTRITITARVGEQGKLYGSVTGVHIAEEVAKLLGGEEFDHRKVLLPEAIKEIGVHPVRLRLTRNVEAAIEVEVIAEGEEPEAAVEAQPEAEGEAEPAGEEDAVAEETEAGSAGEEEAVAEETEAGPVAEEQAEEEATEEPEEEE